MDPVSQSSPFATKKKMEPLNFRQKLISEVVLDTVESQIIIKHLNMGKIWVKYCKFSKITKFGVKIMRVSTSGLCEL